MDWDALDPHVDHPSRRAIVEALEESGEALSARDLQKRIGDPELSISGIGYHANTLVKAGVIEEVAERVTAVEVAPVFDFPGAP